MIEDVLIWKFVAEHQPLHKSQLEPSIVIVCNVANRADSERAGEFRPARQCAGSKKNNRAKRFKATPVVPASLARQVI
jgi:hypothetical protein